MLEGLSKNSQKNLRQKGRLHKCGRVVKGCIRDAGSKVSIGTIPSVYQSIIYRTSTRQAFGTSSIRFHSTANNSAAPNIGPTNYNKEQAFKWKSDENFNKKGYGPLISKQRRLEQYKTHIPGPGEYNLQMKKKFEDSMNTISTLNSLMDNTNGLQSPNSTQGQPRGRLTQKRTEENAPGPGEYEVDYPEREVPGWRGVFNSKVQRGHQRAPNTPGPGTYISLEAGRRTLTQKFKNKESSPSNKQNSRSHPKNQENLNRLIETVMEYKKDNQNKYSPEIPDFTPKYIKVKSSPIFMQGKKDRFGNFEKQHEILEHYVKEEKPGPGEYDPPGAFEQDLRKIKKYQKHAQHPPFMIQSNRELFDIKKDSYGPNVEEVHIPGKKRFLLNLQKKWV